MWKFSDPGFGYLPPEHCRFDAASVVVVPVPYEATTTGLKGTSGAPEAIIRASDLIETYDEVRGIELSGAGISTLAPLPVRGRPAAEMLQHVRAVSLSLLRLGKLPILLGGEHCITPGAVAGTREFLGEKPTLVQVDAHSDLRDSYLDDRYNHACAMRRSLPDVKELIQIGIRAVSEEEARYKRGRTGIRTFLPEVHSMEEVEAALAAVKGPVYLTIDMDGMDPACVPGVGTPEPGGLAWRDVARVISGVCRSARVVAADVVELLPLEGQCASEVCAAKIVWRIISHACFPDQGDG